jgi:hypothetical protein
MARKTIAQLLADVNAEFPDNTTGAITPAIIRSFFDALIESFAPAYAYLTRETPQSLGVVGAVPVVIGNLNGPGFAQLPEWTRDMLMGSITSPGTDPAAAVLAVQATLEFAANDAVELEIFVNGSPSGYMKQATAGEGAGAANPVSVSFGGLVAVPAGPTQYDVRIRSLVGNVSPVVNYMTFLASAVPVR